MRSQLDLYEAIQQTISAFDDSGRRGWNQATSMPRLSSSVGLVLNRDVGFPLWSGGFCKEPKHPRRMVWQKGGPEGALRASIRPKRFSVCWRAGGRSPTSLR